LRSEANVASCHSLPELPTRQKTHYPTMKSDVFNNFSHVAKLNMSVHDLEAGFTGMLHRWTILSTECATDRKDIGWDKNNELVTGGGILTYLAQNCIYTTTGHGTYHCTLCVEAQPQNKCGCSKQQKSTQTVPVVCRKRKQNKKRNLSPLELLSSVSWHWPSGRKE